MDYLDSQTAASTPAMLAISRMLAGKPNGSSEAALRAALSPAALQAGEKAPTLAASLDVGGDIGLFSSSADRIRDDRVWSLVPEWRAVVRKTPPADNHAFRSLVLRLIGSRAHALAKAGETSADVARALAWFVRNDPASPLPAVWPDQAERVVKAKQFDTVIPNKEQWNAVRRWAISLGIVKRTAIAKRELLVSNPSRAISDLIPLLPRRAPANQWFGALRDLAPVLGATELTAQLPNAGAPTTDPPSSVALAVQTLERAGRLELIASADAANPTILRLGASTRSITAVRVLGGTS